MMTEKTMPLIWHTAGSLVTALDAKLCLGFQILEYALMEAPGAPLKQALLDKGFGEDIYGMFETSLIRHICPLSSRILMKKTEMKLFR